MSKVEWSPEIEKQAWGSFIKFHNPVGLVKFPTLQTFIFYPRILHAFEYPETDSGIGLMMFDYIPFNSPDALEHFLIYWWNDVKSPKEMRVNESGTVFYHEMYVGKIGAINATLD